MSLKALVDIIAGRPLLRRKDLARRYGISLDTVERWHANGTLPRAIYLPGCRIPLWKPADIFSAENKNRKLWSHVK